MKRSALGILMLAGLLRPAGLQAFDYAGRWGLTGFGGFNTYAMGDVNDTLSQFNGSLNRGYELGLGLSYGVSSRVLVTAGFGELFNSASFDGGSISLPALSGSLRGDYVFPKIFEAFDLSLGGGLEYDYLDGSTSVDPASAAGGIKASSWGGGGGTPGGAAPSGAAYVVTTCVGSTVGAQASLGLRRFVSEQFALGAEAGYRYAHIYQVTGTTNGVSGPEKETVDYSGLILRVSGTYFF